MRHAALLMALVASAALAQAVLTYPGQRPGAAPSTGSSAPALECYGDSITYGLSFDDTPYPDRLATLTGRRVINYGHGGDTLEQISTRWNGAQAHASTSAEWLLLEGGVNNLRAGAQATDMWATTEALLTSATAAGRRVLVFTVFPFAGTGGFTSDMETQRIAYNGLLKSYAAANGLAVVDGDTFLSDGSTPPRLPAPLDWGDGLHPNGAAYQLMASHAKAAMGL